MLSLITRATPLTERFWSRVDKTGVCWRWMGGHCGKTGYGKLKVKGVLSLAHRVSYELHYGPIPIGMCVLHTCDIRNCVRPEHLFIGTYQDNSDDMHRKGRGKSCFGESNGCAKLTISKVGDIREMYKTGLFSHRELGIMFGVSTGAIQLIVTNRRWKNV